VQILINGGAGSNSTSQKATYGQGHFRDCEELGADPN